MTLHSHPFTAQLINLSTKIVPKNLIVRRSCRISVIRWSIQFGKIIKSVEEDTEYSKKRAFKYAEAGVQFTKRMKLLHKDSDDDVTPIESTTSEDRSEDLVFVTNWSQDAVGQSKLDATLRKMRKKCLCRYNESKHPTIEEGRQKMI